MANTPNKSEEITSRPNRLPTPEMIVSQQAEVDLWHVLSIIIMDTSMIENVIFTQGITK